MDWVKLSSTYYLDPAVASLPDADSEVLFIRGLAYAGLKHDSHGFIPHNVVPSLCRRRRYEAHVEALVAGSLWLPVRGGYRIVRWEEWQEELLAIARRRSVDRDRKRAERERAKQQANGLSRDMSMDSPRNVRTERVRTNPPNPPPSGGTCPRHRRPRRGCAACEPPPARPYDRTVAEALAPIPAEATP